MAPIPLHPFSFLSCSQLPGSQYFLIHKGLELAVCLSCLLVPMFKVVRKPFNRVLLNKLSIVVTEVGDKRETRGIKWLSQYGVFSRSSFLRIEQGCGRHHDSSIRCKGKVLYIQATRSSDVVMPCASFRSKKVWGNLHLLTTYGQSFNEETKSSWRQTSIINSNINPLASQKSSHRLSPSPLRPLRTQRTCRQTTWS